MQSVFPNRSRRWINAVALEHREIDGIVVRHPLHRWLFWRRDILSQIGHRQRSFRRRRHLRETVSRRSQIPIKSDTGHEKYTFWNFDREAAARAKRLAVNINHSQSGCFWVYIFMKFNDGHSLQYLAVYIVNIFYSWGNYLKKHDTNIDSITVLQSK